MKAKVLVAAVVLMAADIAVAQGFQPWGDVFDAADTDNSGGLSKDECDHHPDAGKFPGFGPWFRNHFTDMDADKNGELTKDEMMAGMQAVQITGEDVLNTWREGLGFQPK